MTLSAAEKHNQQFYGWRSQLGFGISCIYYWLKKEHHLIKNIAYILVIVAATLHIARIF